MGWLFKARTLGLIAAALMGLILLSLLGRVVELRPCEDEHVYSASIALANFDRVSQADQVLALVAAFGREQPNHVIRWDDAIPMAHIETNGSRSDCRSGALALEDRLVEAGFTADALACRCVERSNAS